MSGGVEFDGWEGIYRRRCFLRKATPLVCPNFRFASFPNRVLPGQSGRTAADVVLTTRKGGHKTDDDDVDDDDDHDKKQHDNGGGRRQ